MGSNMAEAHPVAFQWVMEAKRAGARVVHVDPRFTRTSALADQYVRIRAGSDIAFLGGVVNHILSNDLDFREYVAAYTNAAFLVNEGFADTEDLDGLFSGYDPATASYDTTTWDYEGAGQRGTAPMETGMGGPPIEGAAGGITQDPTLEHPRCVFQVLKRHFSRYTPEMVERVCGVPREEFLQVCEAWTANSGRDRTAALIYSVGWTQHTVGAQNIRAGAIVQLLLGNIGRPGGGSTRCGATPTSRGRPTSPRCSTCCPATSRCPGRARPTSRRTWTGCAPGPRRATGRGRTPTSSHC
jgi:formate dehydrogenase major subunit